MKEEVQKRISLKNKENEINDELSSYKDEYIEVSSNGLKINKYYFPFLNSKTIPISKIKNINLFELNLLTGKYKLFGFSLNFYYYHFDSTRQNKTHGILIEEEDNMIPIGITPDKSHKCFNVLKYLMTYMKNNKESEPLFIGGKGKTN